MGMKEEQDTKADVKYANVSFWRKQEEDKDLFPRHVLFDKSVSSRQYRSLQRKKHPLDSQYSSMCSDEYIAMKHRQSVCGGGGEDCLFLAHYDNIHLKSLPISKKVPTVSEGTMGDVAGCSISEDVCEGGVGGVAQCSTSDDICEGAVGGVAQCSTSDDICEGAVGGVAQCSTSDEF